MMAVVHKSKASGDSTWPYWSGIVLCILGGLSVFKADFGSLTIPILIACVIGINVLEKKRGIVAARLKGRKLGLNGLRDALPDEYHIFTDVRVHERMTSDFVVTGPTGVFAVEARNYKGTIEGSETDENWILHKVGREGGRYKGKAKNPLIKLRRNINTLVRYLKIEGCPALVDGFAYFPSSETSWRRTIPNNCLCDAEELAEQIGTCLIPQTLSSQQLAKINASLEKCIAGEEPAMTLEEFDKRYEQAERQEIQRNFYESINQPLPKGMNFEADGIMPAVISPAEYRCEPVSDIEFGEPDYDHDWQEQSGSGKSWGVRILLAVIVLLLGWNCYLLIPGPSKSQMETVPVLQQKEEAAKSQVNSTEAQAQQELDAEARLEAERKELMEKRRQRKQATYDSLKRSQEIAETPLP